MKKIVILFAFLIILFSINISALTPNPTYRTCYQETATINTSCGGLNTGGYGYSIYSYFNDENYSTADTGLYNSGYYFNYSIPYNAEVNGTKLRVKYDVGSTGSINDTNITIPSRCLFNNSLRLFFYVGNIAGAYPFVSFTCLNNSNSYEGILYQNRTSGPIYSSIYEESIYWNVSDIKEIEQNYTLNTIENFRTTFSINLGYNPELYNNLTSYLVYNRTIYNSTLSYSNKNNLIYSVNLTTPLVPNNTIIPFYWVLNLSNSTSSIIFNSTQYNQTVQKVELTTNCSVGNYRFMNISSINEESLNSINGTIDYLIRLYSNNILVNTLNGTSTASNNSFCTYQNLSNLGTQYDMQIRYYSTNFSYESYNIEKTSISNLPILIPLYYLSNQTATQFKINYVDFYYLKHPNAIIQIQRQYLDTNSYKTVEIPKISNDGVALGSFNTNNIRYKLIIIENGEILDTFENIFPSCQNVVLGTCELNLRGLKDIEESTTGDFTYTLDKTDNSLTLTFVIPSGTPKTVSLNTNQNSRFLSNISTCSNNIYSSGGTLTCTFNNTIGDSLVSLQVNINEQPSLFGDVLVAEELNDVFLGNNYFIAFILILTLALIFSASGVFKLISAGAGVVFLGLIFLIKGVTLGTVATSLGWLIVAIVIAIYEINKHEENYI